MTADEEREYLIDLLFESARWKVDHDEVLNGLELEIRDRLRRLSGVNTIDEEGLCQSDLPDNLPAEDEALTGADYQALEAARLNEHLASVENVNNARSKWERDKVRVNIDGKHVWKKRSECVRQPRDNSKGGAPWKWVWIGGPQDKKKQEEEAMWTEHEAGNAE